jgi:hypothetical protein
MGGACVNYGSNEKNFEAFCWNMWREMTTSGISNVGEDKIKVKITVLRFILDSSRLCQSQTARSCKKNDENSGFTKGGKFTN